MKLKKISKKWWFIGLGVVIIAVVAISSMNGSDGDLTTVQADLAYIDDISELVTASGRIQPQTKVDIAAEVSAQIIELYVDEGDRVERGTPLLLLDTIQLQATQAQAVFSLDEITARAEASRTQWEKDKLELARQESMFERKLTSETAFTNARFAAENAKANYDASRAQVKTARARLAQADDNLTKTRLVAPMTGVITFLNAEVGEIAPAQTAYTQGRTLATISDLSVFEVEVDVDETEIAKVEIGDSTIIRVDAFRDTTFLGNVVEIGNSATVDGQGTENYTTNFRVKVRFADADPGIRPGMSASVDITTSSDKEAILVPYAAVVTREIDPDSLKSAQTDEAQAEESLDSSELHAAETADTAKTGKKKKSKKIKMTGVFIVNNGEADFKEITTGIADNRNIVALTGVAAGDTVISGSFQTLRKLKDGETVKIDEDSLERIEEEN